MKVGNSSLHDDVVCVIEIGLKVVWKSYVQCICIIGSLSNHEEDGNKDNLTIKNNRFARFAFFLFFFCHFVFFFYFWTSRRCCRSFHEVK